MSEQQLKAFLEQVKADAGLQERLNGADPYTVFAIAEENGFMKSAQDLEQVEPMLSEIELESVAGGQGHQKHHSHHNSCRVSINPACCTVPHSRKPR